jgi:hypothetical protein
MNTAVADLYRDRKPRDVNTSMAKTNAAAAAADCGGERVADDHLHDALSALIVVAGSDGVARVPMPVIASAASMAISRTTGASDETSHTSWANAAGAAKLPNARVRGHEAYTPGAVAGKPLN